MLRKLGTVSGLTLVSRILGFLRDVVLAATLGAGPVADAFMLAFRLPNHFRAILAEGAFNAAFLPTWVRIPRACGHRFHEHVATCSTMMWPPIPRHVATLLR